MQIIYKYKYSIATTPRCGRGCHSFPWIVPFYPRYIPYIAECSARRYQVPFLKSLVWLDLGLNPGLLDHWRTLYSLYIYYHHHHHWPSLATPPNCSLLQAGPLGYNPYPHIAAICKFEPVSLPLLGHVRGSMGEHHLWAHPCISSSVPHVWFV